MKRLMLTLCLSLPHMTTMASQQALTKSSSPASTLSTEEILGLLDINKPAATPQNQPQTQAQPQKTQALDVNALRQGMGQEVLSHLGEIEQKLDTLDGKINQLLKACGASPAQQPTTQPTVEKPAAVPLAPQVEATPAVSTPVVDKAEQPAAQTAPSQPTGAVAQQIISELHNKPDLNKRLQELKEFTDSEGIKSKKPMLRKLLEEKLGEQGSGPSH